MIITPTHLKDAFVLELDQKKDHRGFFARVFCVNELAQVGMDPKVVQLNSSWSEKTGTMRGMHYQVAPKTESKLIRCISGAIWDVIIDMREDSETFGESFGVELSAENRKMLYVPHGFAHGFLTLKDNSEVIYIVSEFYSPQHERGLRWNDPAFAIKWPMDPLVISEKDAEWPLYKGLERTKEV